MEFLITQSRRIKVSSKASNFPLSPSQPVGYKVNSPFIAQNAQIESGRRAAAKKLN
jgi:hypothetical protein